MKEDGKCEVGKGNGEERERGGYGKEREGKKREERPLPHTVIDLPLFH